MRQKEKNLEHLQIVLAGKSWISKSWISKSWTASKRQAGFRGLAHASRA